jgi:hypothetical protein
MKFGGFKLGKSSEPIEREKVALDGRPAIQIAELEGVLKNQTNNMKQTEAKLKNLSGKSKNGKDIDDIPARPHGPIGELTLEPEVDLSDVALIEEEEADGPSEITTETIKLVELKTEPIPAPAVAKKAKAEVVSPPAVVNKAKTEPVPSPAAVKEVKAEPVPPPAAAKEAKVDLSNDSINSLFSQDEEEENLLANLVRSLPDVAASELLDDIKEIKGIIEDWQKK